MLRIFLMFLVFVSASSSYAQLIRENTKINLVNKPVTIYKVIGAEVAGKKLDGDNGIYYGNIITRLKLSVESNICTGRSDLVSVAQDYDEEKGVTDVGLRYIEVIQETLDEVACQQGGMAVNITVPIRDQVRIRNGEGRSLTYRLKIRVPGQADMSYMYVRRTIEVPSLDVTYEILRTLN